MAHLRDGRLVAMLADWCPPVPGLYLTYPGHRQMPVALQAFIDVLKERGRAMASSASTRVEAAPAQG